MASCRGWSCGKIRAKSQLEALAGLAVARGLNGEHAGIGARALQPIPVRPADRALHRTARQFGRKPCLLQRIEDVGLAHRPRVAAEIDIRHKASRAAGDHRQAMIAELGRALPRETAAIRQTVLQARWRQRRPFDSRQRVEPAPIGIEVLTESDLHGLDQLLLRRGGVSRRSLAERHENNDGRTEKRYTNHSNSRRRKQAITAGFLEQKDPG
jgi:hypothetical protein